MKNLSQISSANISANYSVNVQSQKFRNPNVENSFERVPQKDSVSFNGKISEEDLNGKMNVETSDKFWSGKREIKGTILNKEVDLAVKTVVFNVDKVKLTGTINETPVELEMNNYKFTGDISDEHRDILPYIKKLMIDKRNADKFAVY